MYQKEFYFMKASFAIVSINIYIYIHFLLVAVAFLLNILLCVFFYSPPLFLPSLSLFNNNRFSNFHFLLLPLLLCFLHCRLSVLHLLAIKQINPNIFFCCQTREGKEKLKDLLSMLWDYKTALSFAFDECQFVFSFECLRL